MISIQRGTIDDVIAKINCLRDKRPNHRKNAILGIVGTSDVSAQIQNSLKQLNLNWIEH